MYKVMLVDDETLILNGLKMLINWNEIGLEISDIAEDGEEALEKYKKESADIIVTDISMPKLNGLSLINEVKRINKNTRFIILSGYDDFNYAKQAIYLGIENYILKPVNEEELKATLVNTIKKLDALNEKPLHEGKKLEIIRENILSRWVQNNISSYELEERNEILEIDLSKEYYCAGIIKLDIDSSTRFKEGQIIFKKIKEEISKLEMGEAFHDLESNLICVMGSNDIKNIENHFKLFFEELIQKINDTFNIKSFITIGSIEKGFRNAYKSYKEAKLLKEYLLVTGFNKVLNYSEQDRKNGRRVDELLNPSELNKVMMTKDENMIENYIDDIFNKVCNMDNIRPEDIHNTAIKILFMFNDVCYELGFGKDSSSGSIKELVLDICGKETVGELKDVIKNKGKEFISRIRQSQDGRSPIVKRITAYVKDNFHEEISLKTLGLKYNINPSYLGQVFYKEVGEQFSEYINRVRNERARELLLNTDHRINDIAKQVGYTDNSYFYKKFKEVYGVSPNTLRSTRNYN